MEVKQSCYCYMRRHGEFGWKTNLDSFKLSTLKGVIKKVSKKSFVLLHITEKMKCVLALVMVSSFILSNYFPFGESETCTIRNEVACEKNNY
jgi:hypothetical protein